MRGEDDWAPSAVRDTSESNTAVPSPARSEVSAFVCVASPGVFATNGLQTPRLAMQLWMLAWLTCPLVPCLTMLYFVVLNLTAEAQLKQKDIARGRQRNRG
jgi:hypothetical protein